MSNSRPERQLAFLIEADALKGVERQSSVLPKALDRLPPLLLNTLTDGGT